jgi:hypothetical protein
MKTYFETMKLLSWIIINNRYKRTNDRIRPPIYIFSHILSNMGNPNIWETKITSFTLIEHYAQACPDLEASDMTEYLLLHGPPSTVC